MAGQDWSLVLLWPCFDSFEHEDEGGRPYCLLDSRRVPLRTTFWLLFMGKLDLMRASASLADAQLQAFGVLVHPA
jgi:hypothetical protein